MTSRSLSIAALAAMTLLGAGCTATTSTSTTAQPTPSQPTAPAPSQPSTPSPQPSTSMIDACTAVNKNMIKTNLGLTVGDGQSQPSGMQGTTCVFSGSGIIADSVNIQFSPKPDVFFSPAAWEGAEDISGYATGKLRGPNEGSLSAAIVKNGKLATVTVYTMNNSVTKEQFTNLLKAIANQF